MSQQSKRQAERLVAVVVTHNRLAQLKITLMRLLECPAQDLTAVVVVDNAASDGTSEWLSAQNDPRLVTQRLEVNRGGAGGFAAGMAMARDRFNPDWLVVMDDDARPEPGALAAFHDRDKAGIDAVAAAVYFPDGRICEMNRPSRNPFWHGREFLRTALRGRGGFHLSPAIYQGTELREIDVTSFVGFFVSSKGLDLAGLPDPGLFLYGDDGLYTLGLRHAGGRMVFDPMVRFEHDCSTFSAAQRGQFAPIWKAYYYHRNLLLLYRLAAGWMFWPALCLILPRWLWKMRAHGGQRLLYLRLLRRAVRDGLGRRRDVAHAKVLGWAGL
ncbi:glycosyltransferase [Roseovarius sp. Pro17]|uniref:glycosyltransferase n=1 Tax=Roseovarius sp. Pro17 TaxID=3108175 RepID=UPI002D77B443|nr:glycosyltransferase [Roseovarius sp. Pro17]